MAWENHYEKDNNLQWLGFVNVNVWVTYIRAPDICLDVNSYDSMGYWFQIWRSINHSSFWNICQNSIS